MKFIFVIEYYIYSIRCNAGFGVLLSKIEAVLEVSIWSFPMRTRVPM
jgi:hypothetical protein